MSKNYKYYIDKLFTKLEKAAFTLYRKGRGPLLQKNRTIVWSAGGYWDREKNTFHVTSMGDGTQIFVE